MTNLLQTRAAIREASKDFSKSFNIAAWKNEFGADRRNQIARSANAIAYDHRAAATHRFIYDDGEWLVFGWENHHTGRGINTRKLRLVDEPKKANLRTDTQSCRFILEVLTKRTFARENQKSVRELGFGESAQEVDGALPRLQLRAEKNNGTRRRCSPGCTHGVAVNLGGLRRPPVVVNRVRRQSNTIVRNTKGQHQVPRAGGRDNNLVSQSKQERPRNALCQLLPSAMISRNERSSVRAEQKSCARRFRGEVRDPKTRPQVSRMTQNRIETTVANQLPQAEIGETEEGFRARALIRNVGPGVALEQRHIPLDAAAEFRVVPLFGTPQAAIGHVGIDLGMLRQ